MTWPDGLHLVLMPGLDGTGLGFEPLREAMPAGIPLTVVAYPPDRKLSFDETVAEAARRIPGDRPVVLLGESFSGPVAAAAAARHSFDVRGLVLVATFAKPPHPILSCLFGLLPVERGFRKAVPGPLLRRLWGGEEMPARMASLFQRMRALANPEVLAHRMRLLGEMDVREDLSRLLMPCLYIQAAADKVVPPRCLRPFQKALPRLEVARVDGPHLILQSRPAECWGIILAFAGGLNVRRCPGTGGARHD